MDLKAAAIQAYCAAQGYPAPKAEHPFAPGRKYRADLAWDCVWKGQRVRCLLELDGAVYGMGSPCPTCGQRRRGGHSSVTGIVRDIERSSEAALAGWRVLRCTVQDVESGAVYGLIDRLFGEATDGTA